MYQIVTEFPKTVIFLSFLKKKAPRYGARQQRSAALKAAKKQ